MANPIKQYIDMGIIFLAIIILIEVFIISFSDKFRIYCICIIKKRKPLYHISTAIISSIGTFLDLLMFTVEKSQRFINAIIYSQLGIKAKSGHYVNLTKPINKNIHDINDVILLFICIITLLYIILEFYWTTLSKHYDHNIVMYVTSVALSFISWVLTISILNSFGNPFKYRWYLSVMLIVYVVLFVYSTNKKLCRIRTNKCKKDHD